MLTKTGSEERQAAGTKGRQAQLENLIGQRPAGGDTQAQPKAWRALGTQQYDRVQALADQLKAETSAGGGGRKVVAVGVVGSDPYDKLVILQALRSALPEAVFFTTDLDANLLTEESLPVTHNLIVTSTFGLGLNERYRGATMPFRDSYQTAVAHSALLATDFYSQFERWKAQFDAAASVPGPGKLQKVPHPTDQWVPNLYEIGLSGAVVLDARRKLADKDPPPDPNRETPPVIAWTPFVLAALALGAFYLLLLASCPGSDCNRCEGLGGSRYWKCVGSHWRDPAIAGGVVAVGACALALRYGMPADRVEIFAALIRALKHGWAVGCLAWGAAMIAVLAVARVGWRAWDCRLIAVPAGVALFSLAAIVWIAGRSTGEEPVGFLDGVSGWSSEALRLIGLALAGYYTVLATRDARAARDRVRERLDRREMPAGRDERDLLVTLRARVARHDFTQPWMERIGDSPTLLCGSMLLAVGLWLAIVLKVTDRAFAGSTPEWLLVLGNVALVVTVCAVWLARRSNLFREGERRRLAWQRWGEAPEDVLGLIVLLAAVAGCWFAWLGAPALPLRGALAVATDRILLIATLFTMYLLTAFAILRNLFCLRALIAPCDRALEGGAKFSADFFRYLLMLIETYTTRIRRLPLFPCLVIFVLVLSRHSIFDDWSYPPVIIGAVVWVIGVLALVNGIVSYRAKRLQERLADQVRDERFASAPQEKMTPREEESAIESVTGGVFGSFLANPVFRAVLVPLGGGGLLALVDVIGNSAR